MKLSYEKVSQYENEGILFIPSCLTRNEASLLQAEIENLPVDAPGKVFEKDDQTIRALHGSHHHSGLFKSLIRHPKILEPAKQLLGGEAYLYQFKINMKAAFSGDAWPWHQDYVFWHEEDGLTSADIISVAVFADDITQFNGPLFFIPGSHKQGMIKVAAQRSANNEAPNWIANVSADLKYSLEENTVTQAAAEGGISAPVGPRGSVIYFHGNIIHASSSNISPYDRRLILITYCRADNIPRPKGEPRPEFLVSRNHKPLQCWNQEALIGAV